MLRRVELRYICLYHDRYFSSTLFAWHFYSLYNRTQLIQCNLNTVKDNNNLSRHVQSIHEGKIYQCDKCEYQGNQSSNLIRHVKSMHEGKKYQCSVCGKNFSLMENLNVHTKSMHEGVKYTCNICGIVTNRQSNLSQHKRFMHNAEIVNKPTLEEPSGMKQTV